MNMADPTPLAFFMSRNAPGQWVCWDFVELRIRPTHYTIWASRLRSWVLEGSVDGEIWKEIHRQTNSSHFKMGTMASFPVSNQMGCRFIRLTQTGQDSDREDFLGLHAVEFFGTLWELIWALHTVLLVASSAHIQGTSFIASLSTETFNLVSN
jgi:hypothetical protein